MGAAATGGLIAPNAIARESTCSASVDTARGLA